MPYAMLDDMLWADPIITGLTDGAQALWMRATSYCANQLLDGFLPDTALRLMKTKKRYVDELIAAGVWQWHPAGSPLAVHWRCAGGWLAVGWQKTSRSREWVLAERTKTNQRVRGHRNAVTPAVSNGVGNAAPIPTSNSNIQREEADASSSAAAPSARESQIRGFKFVAGLLGRSSFDVAPLGSFAAEYGWIGGRPDAEHQRVAKAVNAEEWCKANPSRVDARHLQRSWQKYLAGDVKQIARALPQPAAAPVPLAHQLMKLEA